MVLHSESCTELETGRFGNNLNWINLGCMRGYRGLTVTTPVDHFCTTFPAITFSSFRHNLEVSCRHYVIRKVWCSDKLLTRIREVVDSNHYKGRGVRHLFCWVQQKELTSVTGQSMPYYLQLCKRVRARQVEEKWPQNMQ
jgi:hypothetical protein